MKYIKEYNKFDIDPFNEDDWDEVEPIEPDGTFLTWLKNKYDESKWKDIRTISCENQNLTDLIGIGKLINLEHLDCSNNQLTELDISNNINLRNLHCDNNQLSKLDLSNNIKLKTLFCRHNQLTNLDVTKNINLMDLILNENEIIVRNTI